MSIDEVILWKVPTAQFTLSETLAGVVTFRMWRDATVPEPNAATLATWRAEYVAQGGQDEAEAEQVVTRREIQALIWAQVVALDPPVTKIKLNNALSKLKTAYKDQPWD